MTVKTPNEQHQPDQKEQPESTRDTIRAAIQEHKEKEQQENKAPETKTEPKAPEVKVEAKKEEVKAPEVKETTKEEVKTEVSSEKKEEIKTDESKKEEVKTKSKAPFGVDKELRAVWDDLPEIAQQRISKLTKEGLDRKAEDGRRAQFREVDQVLTPLLGELQQVNATPAQFVKRLVDYTYALGNPKFQYQAIAQLAHDYGIDLTLFARTTPDPKDPKSQQVETPTENIPPELNAKLDTILSKFSQTETAQRSENEKAALNHLNEWSGYNQTTGECSKKPFYPHVRMVMHQLIASGTIPLKDGKIDLDGAYDAACYAHPEIRDYVMEENNRAAELERAKQEQARQQLLAKAKNAGSSLKPGAPVNGSAAQPNSKVNSKGQPLSVRDSLRNAIAEMRSGQ